MHHHPLRDLFAFIGPDHATLVRLDEYSAVLLTRMPLSRPTHALVLSSVLKTLAAGGRYARLVVSLEPSGPAHELMVHLPVGLTVVRLGAPRLLRAAGLLHGGHDASAGSDAGPPEPPRHPIPPRPDAAHP